MTKGEQLAYLAGIVDADGTIGIKHNTYAMRVIGDCQQASYSERVCVKQVTPEAVDMLHATFGGYRFLAKPTAAKGRPLHGWQVTDRKATAFLLAVLPFLKIKRDQALNCLQLRRLKDQSKTMRVAPGRGHQGSAPRSPTITAAMEALTVTAHRLNRVGV